MPRAKKKRTVVKKFTPDSVTPEVEVVKAPESAEQEVSGDVLALVSKLTEQIASLTTQVQDLSSKQTTIEGTVDTYRKESAEQREQSLALVSEIRDNKKKIMKDLWDSQEKVKMFAPYEGNEKKGARLHVQANGYNYVHTDGREGIPKGMYVSIPTGVFEIASNSMNQQIENIGFDNRIDQRQKTAEGGQFDPSRLDR